MRVGNVKLCSTPIGSVAVKEVWRLKKAFRSLVEKVIQKSVHASAINIIIEQVCWESFSCVLCLDKS